MKKVLFGLSLKHLEVNRKTIFFAVRAKTSATDCSNENGTISKLTGTFGLFSEKDIFEENYFCITG